MGSLIVIVLLAGLLWAFVLVPSRRRQRQHAAMQDAVEVGDEIISAGGIHGAVVAVGDEDLRVEIAPDIVVTLDRRAVAAVATEAVEDEAEDDEPAEPEDDPIASERPPEAS
jgi:preprotein translocase subunit YajC